MFEPGGKEHLTNSLGEAETLVGEKTLSCEIQLPPPIVTPAS